VKVQLSAETARKLNELAASSGRTPNEIAEDALAGYLGELVTVRKRLDSRYDDLKSGRVKALDGEDAFRKLRAKSDQRRLGE
jgi:predicted transcriptional regulator